MKYYPVVLFSREKLATVIFTVILVTVVITGWRLFWFLTDDAFIAFRYVDHQRLGFGLVWNPPPFQPVEGYTSFLWVIILGITWRVTGISPPDAANVLSLGFGLLSLLVVSHFVKRMQLPDCLGAFRLMWLGITALGIVSNRTFLAWLSSGLETSFFNFLFLWWLYEAMTPPLTRKRFWIARISMAASTMALARPDGLLFYGATLLLLWAVLRRDGLRQRTTQWLGGLSLLAVPAHLLWRRSTYGEWVPNTYFAKYVQAWPESGWRYLLSFVLEYSVWYWALLCLAGLMMYIRRQGWRTSAGDGPQCHIGIPIAALASHLGYYTFVIGGDHFEYRVYSHIIPALFLSVLWLATRITQRATAVGILLIFMTIFSWPIPWVHWWKTHNLKTRVQTSVLIQPVAADFPASIRAYAKCFDGLQDWLISHNVCLRHQEHKIFYEYQRYMWPARQEGVKITWDQRRVLLWHAVGVPGWVFPEVAIIDYYGLNDRVIARNPKPASRERQMAHDRSPPPEYVDCFRPNLALDQVARLVLLPRFSLLTDNEIRNCEGRDWLGRSIRR